MTKFNVKLVAFDFDRVIVEDISSWSRIKGAIGVPNTWPAIRAAHLSIEEEKTLAIALLRDRGLTRRDLVRLAKSAKLEPNVREVAKALFEMGKKQYVVTLSPTIYAKVVMNDIHPRAFSGDNGGVYGETVLFDSEGRFVDTFSHPNGARQLWSDSTKLDKIAVI